MNEHDIYEYETDETEARINALKIALKQTESEAVAYLSDLSAYLSGKQAFMEKAVGALVQSMSATQLNRYNAAMAQAESATPQENEVSQLFKQTGNGESGEAIMHKRQMWREELAALENK